MSRPALVRVETRESFVDMAGMAWGTYAEAHRASIAGLLAAELTDQQGGTPDQVAAALLERFTVAPRETR